MSAAFATAQTIYVDACAPYGGDGSASLPYSSLVKAVAAATPGATISLQAGSYAESPITVQKSLTLEASGGPARVGGYFVGMQDVCVPITDTSAAWGSVDKDVVYCHDTPWVARARVYYPAGGPGNAPVACGGPFPLIVYAHGNRCCIDCYAGRIQDDYLQAENILTPLAAAGYIVMSLDVSWFTTAGAPEKGTMLLNALAFVRDENARPGSFLAGTVDTNRVGLAGHSTGGAAAVEAVDFLQQGWCSSLNLGSIRPAALALLAPASGYIRNSYPPLLVFFGTSDCCQVMDGPMQLYASANGPKHFVCITGANHYGYTDALCVGPGHDGPCQVGGTTGPAARHLQQLATRDYLLAFFAVYLRGNGTLSDHLVLQSSGQQCGNPGNPPACSPPRYQFTDLTSQNVQVGVCSCNQ
jgi:hypothetical protein